jgi:hypothetical protein
VRAMRSHYASHFRLPLAIVIAAGLAALGAYSWRSPSSHWFGVAAVGASAVFALILVRAFLITPSLRSRHRRFRDRYSLTFSPQGIHFVTEHIDSFVEWSIYSRALIDAYSYLLYWGSGSFTIIPKRVFRSTEQLDTFEKLLAERVPRIARKI